MLQNADIVAEISQYVPDGHFPVFDDGVVLPKQYANVVSPKQAKRLSLLQVPHIVGVAVQSATVVVAFPQIPAISAQTVPNGHIVVLPVTSVAIVPVSTEVRFVFLFVRNSPKLSRKMSDQ